MKTALAAIIACLLLAAMLLWRPAPAAAPFLSAMARPNLETDASSSATILFGGDMMFDRTVRAAGVEHGGDYLFSCIDGVLSSADFTVANLEGPITDNPSVSLGSEIGSPENFTFTFPPDTAALLARHHLRAVNLGNNHILNFGYDGARSTMQYLGEAGLQYFGDPISLAPLPEDVHGVRFTLVGYNEFGGSASTTIAQIKEARLQGRLPIVYAHWGVEYATTSPGYVQDLAHSFVDAGAEIVIGSHPHVVEEHEIYGGKYIYYSLGNFIFDQYFSPEVRRGLLLRVTLSSAGVEGVEEMPVDLLRDRRTCPAGDA